MFHFPVWLLFLHIMFVRFTMPVDSLPKLNLPSFLQSKFFGKVNETLKYSLGDLLNKPPPLLSMKIIHS